MDRMDYLNRDSFFTGVHEGVIGYDRIIKMLAVKNDELMVEEKGIYSVEKFLIARRLMYWQVYLHKTVLAAEQMLVQALRRARDLVREGKKLQATPNLEYFLYQEVTEADFASRRDELLDHFAALDDYDIIAALKSWMYADDTLLAYISTCLINRRLFKLELHHNPISAGYLEFIQQKVENWGKFPSDMTDYLVFGGKETNSAYSTSKDEIKILHKDGRIVPMSVSADYGIQSKLVTKYYLCYPKEILTQN
jgi:hypothetical protein